MPKDMTVVMPSTDKKTKRRRMRTIQIQEEYDEKKKEWKVIHQETREVDITEQGKEDYSIY